MVFAQQQPATCARAGITRLEIVALLQIRHHLFVDNLPATRIRQHAFGPVACADFDSASAKFVARFHQNDDTIIFIRADTPFLPEALRIVGRFVVSQIGDGYHHHLIGCRVGECRQILLQLHGLPAIEHARKIVHELVGFIG